MKEAIFVIGAKRHKVALRVDESENFIEFDADRQSSKRFLPALDTLLTRRDLSVEDLDDIVVRNAASPYSLTARAARQTAQILSSDIC